jgi:hypothetical protein
MRQMARSTALLFDAAVIEKSGEGWRTRERIANGLGEEPAGGTRPNSLLSQAYTISVCGRVLVLRTCHADLWCGPGLILSIVKSSAIRLKTSAAL